MYINGKMLYTNGSEVDDYERARKNQILVY